MIPFGKGTRKDMVDPRSIATTAPEASMPNLALGESVLAEFDVLRNASIPHSRRRRIACLFGSALEGAAELDDGGTGFYCRPQDALDARDFFDPATIPPSTVISSAALRRADPKRQLFFFGDYED